MTDPERPTGPAEEVRCAECGRHLAEGEARAETEGGTFCEICFANLREQLERALAVQSEDISAEDLDLIQPAVDADEAVRIIQAL